MALNFNFKKTLDFISILERQISQIRMFGKKLGKIYQQSIQSISKITEYKNDINSKSKDRSFKKQLANIDYLLLEKEQSENNNTWINNYFQSWVKINQQNMKQLIEEAKQLETRRLKKLIKQSDILEFKKKLSTKTLEHKKSVQDVIKLLSQMSVKNCCTQVENLTTTMQQMKNNQKKKTRALSHQRDNRKTEQ